MEIKLSKWNMIWIFHMVVIKLSEGIVSYNGELIISPAALVPVGTNLTIICINKRKTCLRKMAFVYEINRDKRPPDWQNRTAAMIQFVNITESHHVICNIDCHGRLHVINMAQLQVGYPPDRPTNVECRLEEFSTEMVCGWDEVATTRLPTRYEVHLKNLQTGADAVLSTSQAVVTFPVNMTQNETHQIQIAAVNPLNQSEWEVVRFLLADIVVPLTPVINNINISDTTLRIYIHWRNQTSENQRYCEVEFRTLKKPSWALVGEKVNMNNIISLEKIHNADSIRVRCREDFGKSYWSNWSAPHLLPPSAPEEIPRVWRLLGSSLPDGVRDVAFLFASGLDDARRVNISGYEVFHYNHGVRTALKRCPSPVAQCVALIPSGVQTVLVAAYNPYGYSPAIHLPLQEEDGSGPQNVTVKSMTVQWQHPHPPAEPIRWYALQWAPDSCDGKHTNISWEKTEGTNYTIRDNVAPGQRVTISVYAVYSTRVSRGSTVYGYSQELKPKKGPSSIKIVKPSLRARIIEWEEIPVCDRRGFITGYTVYITQYLNESNFVYKVPASTRHLLFDKFHPDEQYSVCISASTVAGEGPADHCTNFYQDNDFNSYMGLLVGTAFGVIALSAIILILSRIWKRVKIGLLQLLPKCLHEEYPHVGRSPAVKSLQENIQSPEPPPVVSLDDPEIAEIEEIPKEETNLLIPPPIPAQESTNTMEPPPIPAQESTNTMEPPPIPAQESTNTREPPPIPAQESTNTMEPPPIPPADIEVPSGYRPQITNVSSQQHNSYFSPAQLLDLQRSIFGSESPVVPTNDNFLLNVTSDLFKEINLMVTTDVDLDEEPLRSPTNPTLANLWENQTFIDRLILSESPGDHVISTSGLHDEFDDTKSYFSQIFTGGL